jgi:hypothetical protein
MNINHYLEMAAAAIRIARDPSFDTAPWLQLAIDDLRRALGLANRSARHLRRSIMRALNFARASLRQLAAA